MATLKQKKAVEKILENTGKPMGDILREVGYSEGTAVNPQQVTNSKGWKELMEEYLPDDLLAKVHQEGLEAYKVEAGVRIGGREGIAAEATEIPDFSTRHKYLDSAYKLKGAYAPDKQISVTVDITQNKEDMELAEILNAIKRTNTPISGDTVPSTEQGDNGGGHKQG